MKQHPYGALVKGMVAIGAAVLGYILFFTLMQRPASDISIHATWASQASFANPKSFFYHAAHPLWHVLVALALRTGLPLAHSAALVTALCKGVEVWLLITLAGQLLGREGWLANLSGALTGLVTAVYAPLLNAQVYYGVGSPNPWHSPTQLAAMVMMLLCVPYVARCVETFQRRLPEAGVHANIPWRDACTLAALLFVSLAAKPTFLQAFLPAACLYFLGLWMRRPKNSPFFLRMMAAAAPAVILMVLQYLYYFGIITPAQGEMVFSVTWAKAGDVALSVLLTRLFPIFVLLTCADRETLRKPLYQLTLLMDVVSILEMLLLAETGRRAADGNFGWAMMGSALMLWAITLPLFLRGLLRWQSRRKAADQGQPFLTNHPRLEPYKWGVGSALLLWHTATGVYYLVYLFTTANVL